MRIIKLFALLILLPFISCKNDTTIITELQNIHSTIKTKYAPDKRVEVFDINFELAENQLILEIKESRFFGSKFKIIFKHNSILKRQFLIKDSNLANSELIFENNDKITLARKWIPLVNPYSKIIYNEKVIGKVKMNIFSLERNYEINLNHAQTEIELYLLILFLCTESNVNFE